MEDDKKFEKERDEQSSSTSFMAFKKMLDENNTKIVTYTDPKLLSVDKTYNMIRNVSEDWANLFLKSSPKKRHDIIQFISVYMYAKAAFNDTVLKVLLLSSCSAWEQDESDWPRLPDLLEKWRAVQFYDGNKRGNSELVKLSKECVTNKIVPIVLVSTVRHNARYRIELDDEGQVKFREIGVGSLPIVLAGKSEVMQYFVGYFRALKYDVKVS